MPKRIVPLSDMQISKAKPKAKQYTIFDGNGLFLLVTPTGGKLWRFKFKFEGKENTLSFGAYPLITLAEARDKRQEALKLLTHGVSPSEAKKAVKSAKAESAENSMEVIAREWHGKFYSTWSEDHAKKLLGRLGKEVFPSLGAKPITEITAPDILAMLRLVESRGALDLAHRLRTMCGQIFRYAIATGRAERDPSADLRGALPPLIGGHYAATTDPKELGVMLTIIDGYEGSLVVKSAMQLMPMVFVRPGELRAAEWTEIDFDSGLWKIPGARMKMKQPHIVPLPRQALEILKTLHPYTKHSRYVFPSHRSPMRCMSNNAINAALRRCGIDKAETCAHGFRATARTILDEVMEYRTDWIEHQQAHTVKDPNGRAYNRTKYLTARTEMMQKWSDYLDTLKG